MVQNVFAVYLHWPFSTINVVLHETTRQKREGEEPSEPAFTHSSLLLVRAWTAVASMGKWSKTQRTPSALAQPMCSFPFK